MSIHPALSYNNTNTLFEKVLKKKAGKGDRNE